MRWRHAMQRALYGPDGFFVRDAPAAHFRTSAHASPLFAGALARVLLAVDSALGRPDPFDLVDVGAGRGELLLALLDALPADVRGRVRPTAVELAPGWADTPPAHTTGLLLATEWLDNVPLDLVRNGRYLLEDGSEGPPVEPADAEWLDRWWPDGVVAEVGTTRDAAWASAVATVDRGLAVDYGHLRADRPPYGTLTGYRDGREVPPVADGTCDLTAHVAIDSCAAAGGDLSTVPPKIVTQREALRALGVDGARPPLDLAHHEPGRYLRELSSASQAAELTDAAGLGGHYWLVQPKDVPAVIPGVL